MPEFVTIAKVGDIPPGTAKSFQLKGLYVAVFNCGGKFYASSNICKHEGGFLADGYLTGTTVMCPLHGWEYQVDSGECLTAPGANLKTYPLQVHGDEIQVALG